uniref:Uncharacterized protein n=1 Tax=Gadus morhua TaxID=8049 RepID=A0A8C5BLK5_GADMO
MACANTSWSEENFSCSLCLDVFNSPVTTACGHNFCRTCITNFWDEQVQYKCPVCNEIFHTRHDLRVNTFLSELAAQIRTTVRVKEQPSYGPSGRQDSHPVVPLKEEYEVKTAHNKDAEREIAHGGQVFTALIGCVEKGRDEFNQTVQEKLKSTVKRAEDLIKELEQEIEDLTNQSSEVKRLSHTEDHLHFLQTFRSLKDPPPTRDWTTVEVRPPSYVGTLRRSLDQLEETLNMERKKLSDAELKRVQQYEVYVTLDPDTAHTRLILSEDGKQVHDGAVVKKLPDNPERFTWYTCVLTRQSFSSGRFYFEVQVKDKTAWWLGVARESIDRKGFTEWTPETGYWTLDYDEDGLVFNDDPDVDLPLRAELQKVGVFVDYDEGLVSFYDVEARVHIYSATGCTFTEPLYPFLCPWLHREGTNSAPLIISPNMFRGLTCMIFFFNNSIGFNF